MRARSTRATLDMVPRPILRCGPDVLHMLADNNIIVDLNQRIKSPSQGGRHFLQALMMLNDADMGAMPQHA